MKTLFLSLAAIVCFTTAASAQNEVPGVPSNRDASADENVYAPTRMERTSGTETQQQQYDPADPKQAPAPGTATDPKAPGTGAQSVTPANRRTEPADKPKNNTTNRNKMAR